ncbi:transcription factor bHLH111-like isoform X1 [Pistacia vera]|uniref:transcription factor bHLH111-like isoform X1 n=1 Tax=Pistacia vera TaxID=55513 RepID=UPI001263322C|nr:transcription factor bHLH111-like isoform X1 [Pistacia vera]
MAKECTESSVTTSPSPPNWWDLHHATSLSSWNNTGSTPWHQQNINSNSSCEEEVSISTSFTYASNQSGLTVDSSHRLVHEPASSTELIGEHTPDNHLWSHVLSSVGSNGDLHNSQDVGANLLDALSSKSISIGIFEPAYDYLKKMDTNWEFTNSSSFNDFDKHLNGGFSESSTENERLNKLSNLVSHWSIAPPDPEINRHFDPQTCNISLSSSMDHQYNSQPNFCHMKPRLFADSTPSGTTRNSGILSYYGHHDLKVENEHQDCDTPTSFIGKSFNTGGLGNNHVGLNSTNSMVEGDNKYYYGMSHSQYCTNARNFADAITLSSRLTKPLIDIHVPKPYFKSLNLSDCKKRTSSPTTMNGRERGTNEWKKKRSEQNSEAVLKKPKTESSASSSLKVNKAPKVKLGDRITALQQIVSPFGKTDTASVLYEAIIYIKSLQEQVQLLSNPYMKSNLHKDPWGGLDRKEKGDVKIDLRSRGLCLVPVSCTPKVYHENTGSDYWTPAYRGCLYR